VAERRLVVQRLRGNKMYSLTPDGKLKIMLDHAGGSRASRPGANKGSNAMVPDKDGTVLMNRMAPGVSYGFDADMHITPFWTIITANG